MTQNYKFLVDSKLRILSQHVDGKEDLLHFSDSLLGMEGLNYLAQKLTRGEYKSETRFVFHLNLRHCALDDRSIPTLLKILPKMPNLHSLNLANNGFSAAGIAQLVPALEKLRVLEALEIGHNPLGEAGGAPVARIIRNASSKMRWLRVDNAGLGDAGLVTVASALAENGGQIESIDLSENSGRQAAGEALAAVIRKDRRHVQFFAEQEDPACDRLLRLAFLHAASPNLLNFSPETPEIQARTAFNSRHARAALAALVNKSFATNYSDLAKTILRDTSLQKVLRNTPGALPVPHLLRDRDAHLARIPGLPEAGTDFGEALFRPNHYGFAPLDNPKIWLDAPTVFERLKASGTRVDSDFLHKKTKNGVGFLASAAAMLPVAQVMGFIHLSGTSVRKEHLLDANGQPNDFLQEAVAKDEVQYIFTLNNWWSAPYVELVQTLAALPDSTQTQIRKHSLLAQVRAAQQPAETVRGHR